MRRSRGIRLTILAASAMALQACGSEDVDAVDVVIPDLAACVERFGAEAQAECERNLADGQARHALTAPRFASVEACRDATGSACEAIPATRASDKALAAPGLTSVAIPVMAGLLIGRMLENGSGRVTTPLYAGRPPPQCQPGQPTDDCTTTTSTSSRTSTSSTGSGRRFYYSAGSYAGSAPEQRSAATFAPSTAMASTITAGRAGAATSIARGGFGASARGFSSAS